MCSNPNTKYLSQRNGYKRKLHSDRTWGMNIEVLLKNCPKMKDLSCFQRLKYSSERKIIKPVIDSSTWMHLKCTLLKGRSQILMTVCGLVLLI